LQEDNYGEKGPNIRSDDDDEHTLLYITLKVHHNRSYNRRAVQNNKQELTLCGFFSPSPTHAVVSLHVMELGRQHFENSNRKYL